MVMNFISEPHYHKSIDILINWMLWCVNFSLGGGLGSHTTAQDTIPRPRRAVFSGLALYDLAGYVGNEGQSLFSSI